MADRHWSDEQLLARLYGVEPGDGHLDECAECLQRWREISLRRREFLQRQRHISPEFLEEQRKAIRRRVAGERRRPRLQLVPVLAALLLVVAALTLFQPRSNPPVPQEPADNTVFEDAFNLASGDEPEAIEPIQALFEVQQ